MPALHKIRALVTHVRSDKASDHKVTRVKHPQLGSPHDEILVAGVWLAAIIRPLTRLEVEAKARPVTIGSLSYLGCMVEACDLVLTDSVREPRPYHKHYVN